MVGYASKRANVGGGEIRLGAKLALTFCAWLMVTMHVGLFPRSRTRRPSPRTTIRHSHSPSA